MANKGHRNSPNVRPRRKITAFLGGSGAGAAAAATAAAPCEPRDDEDHSGRSSGSFRLRKFLQTPSLRSLPNNNNNNSNSNDEIHNSSLSSLAFNDDDLLISPRSPSKRNFLVMRRNSLDSALLPKAPTLLRTVRFEDPERLVKVHLTPPMSEQEVADSFWSEEELQVMLSSASQMAEDAAWKKDRNIVMCIQLCYGLSPDLEVKSKKDYSWLTPEKAINFYYSFKILDETETRTVLRGLEHQISPEIDDYRVQCIQKVLALQSTIQENAHKSSKDRWTWDHLENSLRKQSMELSCRSRRFARLLGKADAAVLGHKVYKGQQKPSKVKRDTTV